MPQSAVLFMDLQRDFLASDGARMPVDVPGATAVLEAANALLSKRAFPETLPILVLNQFPASARIGNFFRNQAAIADSWGAQLDERLELQGSEKRFAKDRASAFSNPDLHQYLSAEGIRHLYVVGVYAEGCVRATVLHALQLGYSVDVVADAVATNAAWKKRFALWSMKRAGASILPDLRASR